MGNWLGVLLDSETATPVSHEVGIELGNWFPARVFLRRAEKYGNVVVLFYSYFLSLVAFKLLAFIWLWWYGCGGFRFGCGAHHRPGGGVGVDRAVAGELPVQQERTEGAQHGRGGAFAEAKIAVAFPEQESGAKEGDRVEPECADRRLGFAFGAQIEISRGGVGADRRDKDKTPGARATRPPGEGQHVVEIDPAERFARTGFADGRAEGAERRVARFRFGGVERGEIREPVHEFRVRVG